MAGDDAVEFGQRLDLVDDDPAHLGGAFGGFLRQFEDAAMQLGAGGFQLALHLGRHLLHALHRLGKAVVGLAEQRMGVAGGLIVDRPHRFGGLATLILGVFADAFVLLGDAAALVLGGFTDALVLLGDAATLLLRMFARGIILLADRTAALGGRLRHDAGDIARAGRRRLEQFIEQAGEALEPLVEILGADVERGDQGIERDPAFIDAFVGALIAAFDQFGGAGQAAAMRVELDGELAEIGEHPRGDVAEIGDIVFHACRWRRRSRR